MTQSGVFGPISVLLLASVDFFRLAGGWTYITIVQNAQHGLIIVITIPVNKVAGGPKCFIETSDVGASEIIKRGSRSYFMPGWF